MKKKQEEYVSQFDFDDLPTEESTERVILKCKKCGNYSVSLYEGVCFDCRQNESSDNLKERLAEEEKKESRMKLVINTICLVVLCLIYYFLMYYYTDPYFAAGTLVGILLRALGVTIVTGVIVIFVSIIKESVKWVPFIFDKLINKIKNHNDFK